MFKKILLVFSLFILSSQSYGEVVKVFVISCFLGTYS